MTVANELFVDEADLTRTTNKFLDELNDQMESRLQITGIITHLSALNLSQVPPDATEFHGVHEVTQLAELFNFDVDDTLFQWSSLKTVLKRKYMNAHQPRCLKH